MAHEHTITNTEAVEVIKFYIKNIKTAEPGISENLAELKAAAAFTSYAAHANDPGKYAYHPHPYNEAETIMHHAADYLYAAVAKINTKTPNLRRLLPTTFTNCPAQVPANGHPERSPYSPCSRHSQRDYQDGNWRSRYSHAFPKSYFLKQLEAARAEEPDEAGHWSVTAQTAAMSGTARNRRTV